MFGCSEGEVAAVDLDAVVGEDAGGGGAVAPHRLVADIADASDEGDFAAEVSVGGHWWEVGSGGPV